MLWRMKLKRLIGRNSPRDLERDLDDELLSHIAMKAEELEANGMSAREAGLEARRRFGNLTSTKESTRELHVFQLLETFVHDIRYGLRRLRHESAFTLAAVLTLGLVIGANGAIFSVLEAILLRPLPFADPSKLLVLYGSNRESNRQMIPAIDLEELQSAKSIAGVAAETTQSVNLTGVEEPGRLIGGFVSESYFPLLGIQPAMGRGFTKQEGTPGGPRVCVLSYPVWRNRFGGDEAMLGRSLILNAEAYEIIGILPESYRPTFTNAEVWIPLPFYPNYSRDRGRASVLGLARMAEGVTERQVQAEIATISQRLAMQFPETNRDRGLTVESARDAVAGSDTRKTLFILTGAVSCLLLLGCANIAALLLTKSAGRRHEMAIRASIGASRGRLVRQLLTESLLLSLFGGSLGIALAYGGMQLIAVYCGDLAGTAELRINSTVLLYLIGASLTTGILFGLAPALLTHAGTANALRQRGIAAVQGGFRGALVVAQVALALVVLTAAGLMVKSVSNIAALDPGFRGERVLTMEYRVPRNKYPQGGQQTQFHQEVVARVAALPGVESAGLVGGLPFSGNTNRSTITLPDRPEPPRESPFIVQSNTATPNYFATAGIPLLAGRDFRLDDGPESAQAAIVSQAFAARFWPGDNALGKQILFPGPGGKNLMLTVVGVVGDTKTESLDDPAVAQLYRPYAQSPFIFATLAVRTAGDPMAMTKSVQRAIWSIDKDQPMWKIRTLQFLVDRSFSIRRYTSYLLVCFSVLALGLAGIGLYGVLAYAVNQRTAEFGVRMALGASPREILALVLRKGLALTLAGLAAGVVASLFATQYLQSQIFGISATDPSVYIAVSTVLLAVAAIAVTLPARQAMLVDPVIAIRQE